MSERGEYNELTAPQLRELIKLIREQNEEILDDFYWENVAPLEKQLELLGHKPKKSKGEIISFRPNRKIDEKNKCKLWNYSESTNEYILFFTQLMFELWKAELLIKPKNFSYTLKEKTNPNTVNFVRCFDGLSGLMDNDQLTWQGEKQLCVYMIEELIRLKIISDHKKWILTEKIFGITDPARKLQKYGQNHKYDHKPKNHKIIDDIINNVLPNKNNS